MLLITSTVDPLENLLWKFFLSKYKNAIDFNGFFSLLASSLRRTVLEGMKKIEETTCVRFKEQSTEQDYVSVDAKDNAYVLVNLEYPSKEFLDKSYHFLDTCNSSTTRG